ncbi:MAG: hypothetical protein HXY38_00090 [Chloroflexi bacterium]|nr:hypothetical protein [Chloroflexota bacterium]
MMILRVLAALFMLVGIIWILQGVNLLPGSFMTGDPQWTINGAIAAAIGLGIFAYTFQKK